MKILIGLLLLTTSAFAQIDTDSGARQANGSSAPQNCQQNCDLRGNCTISCL